MAELLKVTGLKKYFPRANKFLKAVDDVSIHIDTQETLGLVGESGSGKSTLGKSILRLIEPTAGEITFEGLNFKKISGDTLREKRKDMQIIFQDPLASLNPQMSIGESIEDPLTVHRIGTKSERKKKVKEMLDIVGLGRRFLNAFPNEFSGGQQQRVGVARALILNPKFIVCDEPVSSLDVSIQAQIIKLLSDLKDKFGLSFLFITHDLAVIKYISDRVAVMYLGKLMELAKKEDLFKRPLHPYTKALLESVPKIPWDGKQQKKYPVLKGEIPSPIDLPSGCRFNTRCPIAIDECSQGPEPELKEVAKGHKVACIKVER